MSRLIFFFRSTFQTYLLADICQCKNMSESLFNQIHVLDWEAEEKEIMPWNEDAKCFLESYHSWNTAEWKSHCLDNSNRMQQRLVTGFQIFEWSRCFTSRPRASIPAFQPVDKTFGIASRFYKARHACPLRARLPSWWCDWQVQCNACPRTEMTPCPRSWFRIGWTRVRGV